MPKTAKVAISLPEEVLNEVERERGESGESRSQFFRRAVEALLERRRSLEMSARYTRAYEQVPETRQEVEAARRAAGSILSEEPWQ
ncbi:MAG: ribbon-helix-helix protein, CopG family [Chloroflexota bacterium]